MAQKTKMINTQWLTNNDIYRSEIKKTMKLLEAFVVGDVGVHK